MKRAQRWFVVVTQGVAVDAITLGCDPPAKLNAEGN